jgi:hypothetical protein
VCQIFYTNGEQVPTKKLLEEAAEHNSHGTGLMWFTEEGIRWEKGIQDPDEAIKFFLENRGTRAIHFRSASVGGVRPELTHPFPIDQEVSLDLSGLAERALMHNGTWGGWKDLLILGSVKAGVKPPRGPWSDSRAMAFLTHLLGPGLWDILDLDSRILIFDKEDMIQKRPPTLLGKWIDSKEGWWHSQEFFRYRNFTSTGSTNYGAGFNSRGYSVEDRRGSRDAGDTELAHGGGATSGKEKEEEGKAPQVRLIKSVSNPRSPASSLHYSVEELHTVLSSLIVARKRAGRPAPQFRGMAIDA